MALVQKDGDYRKEQKNRHTDLDDRVHKPKTLALVIHAHFAKEIFVHRADDAHTNEQDHHLGQ
jgi:predicted transposase YbfD/YdcC